MEYTRRELMVAAAARQICDGDKVFVGMRLPLLGFAVAKETHAPRAIGIFENGVIRDWPALESIFTMSDPPNIAGALSCGGLNDVMYLLQSGRVGQGVNCGRRDRPFRQPEHPLGGRAAKAHSLAGQRRRSGHRHDGEALHHHHESREAPFFGEGSVHHFAGLRRWRQLARKARPFRRRPEPGDHQHGNFLFRWPESGDDADVIPPGRCSEHLKNDTGGPLRYHGSSQRRRRRKRSRREKYDRRGIWTG
jgi:hypothetical protein